MLFENPIPETKQQELKQKGLFAKSSFTCAALCAGALIVLILTARELFVTLLNDYRTLSINNSLDFLAKSLVSFILVPLLAIAFVNLFSNLIQNKFFINFSLLSFQPSRLLQIKKLGLSIEYILSLFLVIGSITIVTISICFFLSPEIFKLLYLDRGLGLEKFGSIISVLLALSLLLLIISAIFSWLKTRLFFIMEHSKNLSE